MELEAGQRVRVITPMLKSRGFPLKIIPINRGRPDVYAAAGYIAQSLIARSAEELRGTMKLGLLRCSGIPNRRV